MLLSGSIVETRTTQSNRRRNYFGSIMEGRIRIGVKVLSCLCGILILCEKKARPQRCHIAKPRSQRVDADGGRLRLVVLAADWV